MVGGNLSTQKKYRNSSLAIKLYEEPGFFQSLDSAANATGRKVVTGPIEATAT